MRDGARASWRGRFVVAATEVTARQRACVVDRRSGSIRPRARFEEVVRVCPMHRADGRFRSVGRWAAQAARRARRMIDRCTCTVWDWPSDASDVRSNGRVQDCPGRTRFP